MDSQKFINKYIQTLTDQVNALTVDKISLQVQISLMKEELEETQKKLSALTPDGSSFTN